VNPAAPLLIHRSDVLSIVYCDVSQFPQRRSDDVYETGRRSAGIGIQRVTGRPRRRWALPEREAGE
jgi:hypothetical protein